MEREITRTWAEIDLEALAHNYRVIRRGLSGGCRLLGPCGADAWGHGAAAVGKKLERLGAELLSVDCLEEALALRRAGIRLPILCLGTTPGQYVPLLLEHGIIQAVGDSENARTLSQAAERAGRRLSIHLEVDTGATRRGVLWREDRAEDSARALAELCSLPGLAPEGLMTRFADSSGSEGDTVGQLARFLDVRMALARRGISFKICHCADSGAVVHYPCTHLDLVRPGLMLYGYAPDQEARMRIQGELRPVMQLKSRVEAVREIPAGALAGCARRETLERDSRLAVLPVGYGDGFCQQLSQGGRVLLGGRLCPVVGAVCMDLCMVDLTDAPAVRPGDVAVVYGQAGLLEEAAQRADASPQALLCGVSSRVPRIYLAAE